MARLRLVSRRAGREQAHELSVEGGEQSGIKPAAHPVGTSVEVRDLFYNVPARRKFVRSEATEFGHILRQVERLALSLPAVGLQLRHNGREMLDLPAAADRAALERRIDRILGADFRSHALALASGSGPIGLSGWLGPADGVAGAGRSCSTGSSMPAPCATGCSPAPRGSAIAMCSITAGIRATCCT